MQHEMTPICRRLSVPGVLFVAALLATACGSPAVPLASGEAASPLFWTTWWFWLGIALILVGVVYGGYRLWVWSVEARSRELERQAANRARELAALNAIATVVSGSLDLDQILNDALDKTLEVTGLEAGGIYLLQEDASPDGEGVLRIAAYRGLTAQLVEAVDNLAVGEGFSGRVVQTGQPLLVRDLPSDQRLTRMVVKERGYRSVAIAPLVSGGKVLGSLFVMSRSDAEFSKQDVELLSSIGGQIGVAIENARLYKDTRSRLAQVIALQETSTAVVSTLELDELLNRITRQATTLLQADGGILNLVDWDREEDEVVACVGSTASSLGARNPLKAGLSGWATLHNQPVISNQVQHDNRVDRRELARLEAETGKQIQNAAVAPLTIKDQVMGTLVIVDKQGGKARFDQSDLDLLVAFANQAATAIENARLFKAVHRRAEQFRVISEVGQQITSILDIDEVLVQLVRLIQRSFGYDHVAIALIEGDEAVYKVGAGKLWDDSEFEFQPGRLKVGQEGVTGWVAATGQPLLVPDVDREPHYVWMQGSNTRSELTVPIKVKGNVIGVLDVQSERLDAFDGSDLAMLQSLANQAAVAIENAHLFDAEQRRAEQFRVISEVSRRITSILAVDELLGQMAHLIRETFGYYGVGIGLVEADKVIYKAGAGAFQEVIQAHQPLHLKVGKEGLTGWVAATGEPLVVPDVSQDPRYYYVPEVGETQSEICVPLKTKRTVIGVMVAQSDQLDAFDESDLVVLQTLADQAAVAIENARLFDSEQRLYHNAARQVRELRALTDASRIISSVLDQDQLLAALYEQVTHIAPADFFLIALYDKESNVVSIEINEDEGVRYPKEQYVLDKGLLTLVIHGKQTLRFDSLTEEKHKLAIEIVPAGSKKVNHGWLGVPMLYGDRVLGAIIVGSYQRGAFDEGHQQALTSIANQAAVALENARLYDQAQRLAVMEERQRLARELHDAVTQTLFSASLIAEALPELWASDQEEGRQLLRDLRQLSRGALAEMRTLLLELRPAALIDANLGDLLRQLGEAVAGRTGIPVTVSVEVDCLFPPDVHVAFYRIAQEALNNVVKHARASQVAVSLHCTRLTEQDGEAEREAVQLTVTDDGCGFDPKQVPPDRLGLGIIHERSQAIGAALEIESRPGQGTHVAVTWEKDS